MENLINVEQEKSRSYRLKCVKDNNELVALTQDNVARVEAMINIDSRYKGNNQKIRECVARLKEVLAKDKVDEESCKAEITSLIKTIDKTNSTHINSDGVGIDEISKRITDLILNKQFLSLLENENGKYELIEKIAEKTNLDGKESNNGNKYKGRCNYSFASKFCHYVSFYLFEEYEKRELYPIYDGVLRKNVLPKYIKYYKLDRNEYNLNKYSSYCKAVNDILNKANNRISKNGFDHLLWYYYKGK